MGEAVAVVREEMASLSERVQSVAAGMVPSAEITRLRDLVGALSSKIDLAATKASVTTLRREVDDALRQNGELRAQAVAPLAALGEQIRVLEVKVEGWNPEVKRLRRRVADLSGQLEAQIAAAATKASLTCLEREVDALKPKAEAQAKTDLGELVALRVDLDQARDALVGHGARAT
jgi:predicted  nucleic acid-binding Zn-ribbon protein